MYCMCIEYTFYETKHISTGSLGAGQMYNSVKTVQLHTVHITVQ